MVCCQRYQDLPGFTHFGWIKDDEEYEPFMTDKLCVPQSVSKLVICSCKMYVCDSICCNNSNKGLICLDICYQLNCSNVENEKLEFDWEVILIIMIQGTNFRIKITFQF